MGSSERRAVVAGAGIAGLATALRLRQAGWDAVVVERAPARRSSGYLVNVVGQGYDAAEQLGLVPALTKRDLGFFTSILVRADGSRKFTVPAALAQAAVGSRALTVFRGDLESALYDLVHDSVEMRFGTTVTEIAQDGDEVRLGLSDGTTERAALLVGADGLHSGIRELVFGPGFRADMRHLVGAFPLGRVPAEVPEGAGTTFIGPGRTAAVINLGPGRSSAFFTYRASDPEPELARGAVGSLTAAFGDLGGGVPDALAQLADDPAAAYFDSVSQVMLDGWSQGRVVLLGDAAWCVTLFAGFGAALALTGADRLGAELAASDVDVPAALTRWESSLRPAVIKRQALARKGMSQFCPPSQAHVVARDLAMRLMALPVFSGLIRRAMQRANS